MNIERTLDALVLLGSQDQGEMAAPSHATLLLQLCCLRQSLYHSWQRGQMEDLFPGMYSFLGSDQIYGGVA